MNHIKFDFNGANIRVAIANQDFTTKGGREIKKGSMLMAASDVARALGYANPAKSIIDQCDPKGVTVLVTPSAGGPQKTKFIDWPEVYKLILSSKLETALRFRAWVTEEVLPAINDNGQYRLPGLDEYADLEASFSPGWYDITTEQMGVIEYALRLIRPRGGHPTEHDELHYEALVWRRQFRAYREGERPAANAYLLNYAPRPTLDDGSRPRYIRQVLTEALRDVPTKFTFWDLCDAALENHRFFLSHKTQYSIRLAFEGMVRDGMAKPIDGSGLTSSVYQKCGRAQLSANAQN